MENIISAMRVRDANGDELTLYEYQQFVPHLTMLGVRRGAGNKHLVLDTGEPVTRIADDAFLIVATGERLTKIA
jgi:hypothetical protein